MHPESLRLARHWLVTGLEKGRDFIVLRDDIEWLQSLTLEAFETYALCLHTMQPEPISFVYIPKDDGAFRNVPVIPVRDRLLLTALVINNYAAMMHNVRCNNTPGINYQYPLPQNPQDASWINEWKEPYHAFRLRTQGHEDAGSVVLNTDISNCGGSCRHDDLLDAVTRVGWKPNDIVTLGRMLASWAEQGVKGVPQGLVVTELLMNAYLSHVDGVMTAKPSTVEFYRYSDDIRIIGNDVDAVYEAQFRLQVLLGDVGMQLKADKTFVSGGAGAHQAPPAFRIETAFDPVLKVHGIAQGLKTLDTNALPVAVLEDVYTKHLSPVRADPARPNQTLFNFTINRLGKAGSSIVHPDLAHLIHEHPGKVLDLVRYGISTGYDGFAAIADSMADAGHRAYFKYAVLLRGCDHVSEGRSLPASMLDLATKWLADPVAPSFVAAKGRELKALSLSVPDTKKPEHSVPAFPNPV